MSSPAGGDGTSWVYATLTELKGMRRIGEGDTQDDAALLAALTRASRAIDRRTGRRPGGFSADAAATTRTFDPRGRVLARGGTYTLLVDEIASEAEIAVDGFSDLTYGPENAIARLQPITGISGGASYGVEPLSVTAFWGWPAVPDSIIEATLLLANRRFMRRDSPEGVAGWAQEGAVRVSRFDPDIEDLIEPFTIPGFA